MQNIDLVIKIGSMALIRQEDKDIDYNIFSRLGAQLRPGMVVVSSGAVEIGRLDYIDLLVANRLEAQRMLQAAGIVYDGIPENELALLLKEHYECENVVLTLGAYGYAGYSAGAAFSGSGVAVAAPVDTSGAGDGFLAALVAVGSLVLKATVSSDLDIDAALKVSAFIALVFSPVDISMIASNIFGARRQT